PLIFISFGGTSLMSALFAVGVLLNISRQLVFAEKPLSQTIANRP
ncbi:MAG: cell division protein FtsW, partial [Candidatus Margulisiibacteriota bacterium]